MPRRRPRRLLEPLVLAALSCFVPVASRAQEGSRAFCTGSACIPDKLVIQFLPSRESTLTLDGFQPGREIRTRVVVPVQTAGIKGWSYAVAHDPEFLTLVDESVTTAGTAADPTIPGSPYVEPAFNATKAVDGGYISGVILSFITPTQLPPGETSLLCFADYTLAGNPGEGGTRVRFASGELHAPGSPPTDIGFTVGTATKGPATVVDGILRVEKSNEGPCPDWALFFGPEPSVDAFDARGADSIPVILRNKAAALSFQLGLRVESNEEDGGFFVRFSNELGSSQSLRIGVSITDAANESRVPIFGNEALADLVPIAVERGSTLAPFQGGDFFAVNLAPRIGGRGLTVGYAADLEADPASVLPATAVIEGECPVNEVLIIRLGEPQATNRFIRGDLDGSGTVELNDAVSGLGVLFRGEEAPVCLAALDADGNGAENLTDMIAILNYLFQGGPEPAAPFPDCGEAEITESCAASTAFCATGG